MISSKLTSKARTTIPQPVRAALHLEPGDQLVYEIVDQRVILTKARTSGRTDDPFRTFHEWSTAAAGLPVPSVIRTAKIATIEAADAAKLGTVAAAVFRRVANCLARALGLDTMP